jgi:hypothetical protein
LSGRAPARVGGGGGGGAPPRFAVGGAARGPPCTRWFKGVMRRSCCGCESSSEALW